jgi:hypothetical protein
MGSLLITLEIHQLLQAVLLGRLPLLLPPKAELLAVNLLPLHLDLPPKELEVNAVGFGSLVIEGRRRASPIGAAPHV